MSKKVVVIGGGFAGLNAAYTLKKQGVDFVLLEAAATVGGRARSYVKNGFAFEAGAMFSAPQWTTHQSLIQELGLRAEYSEFNNVRMGIWRNNRAHYFVTGLLLTQLKNFRENLRFRGLSPKAFRQFLRVASAVFRASRMHGDPKSARNFERLLALPAISVEEFSLQLGGREFVDEFLSGLIDYLILGEAEHMSIAHLVALAGMAEGIGILQRGLASITDGIHERIADSVRLNTPVRKVVIENSAVKGVEIDDGFIEADHVVSALTADIALKVMPGLPDAMATPLRTVTYSSNFNYMLAVDKKLTPDRFVGLILPRVDNSLFSTIVESAGKGPFYAPPNTSNLHFYTANRHYDTMCRMTEEDRRNAVLKEAERYFPGITKRTLMIECVQHDQCVNMQPPGQFQAISRMQKDHLDDVKGLYLCGEYMFLIASTEGAATTGAQAAMRVMKHL